VNAAAEPPLSGCAESAAATYAARTSEAAACEFVPSTAYGHFDLEGDELIHPFDIVIDFYLSSTLDPPWFLLCFYIVLRVSK
jgi:hypothetical protein